MCKGAVTPKLWLTEVSGVQNVCHYNALRTGSGQQLPLSGGLGCFGVISVQFGVFLEKWGFFNKNQQKLKLGFIYFENYLHLCTFLVLFYIRFN